MVYQVGALSAFARAHGAPLSHVKPHGALYNQAADDLELAQAIARGVARVDRGLVMVGLAGSLACGKPPRPPACASPPRPSWTAPTTPRGRLVPRSRPGAVTSDPAAAAAAALRLARDRAVRHDRRPRDRGRGGHAVPARRQPARARRGARGPRGARGRRGERPGPGALSRARVLPLGNAGWSVELGDTLDEATNARVRALDRELALRPFPGFVEAVPTLRSLLVLYDERSARPAAVGRELALRLGSVESAPAVPGRLHEVPTLYGGDAGPDLAPLARERGLSGARARPAPRVGRVHRVHAGLQAGLRLSRARAPGARVRAPQDAAGAGPGGLGGARGTADRDLPRDLPRRLAARRPHVAAPLRSLPRGARARLARRPRAVHSGRRAARARAGGAAAARCRRRLSFSCGSRDCSRASRTRVARVVADWE